MSSPLTSAWAPRGSLGAPTFSATPVTTAAAAASTLVSATYKLVAGRRYELIATAFGMQGSVLADNFQFNLTTTGSNVIKPAARYERIQAVTANQDGPMQIGYIAAATTESVTLAWTVNRQAGTGTATVSATAGNPITLSVKDIGPV